MEAFLENFHFLHHPLLPSPYSLRELVDNDEEIDFLIIEGALSHNMSVIERNRLGIHEILSSLVKRAKYIICAGSCASFGGLFSERDSKHIYGAVYSGEKPDGFWKQDFTSVSGHRVVNIPGCPLHPRWLAETLVTLREEGMCSLDNWHRPREIFSYLAHHGCMRNEYFEWKVDCIEYGHKEGCLFYDQGCQGPMTHANCNKILWNEVSSKTRAGSPCLGCTEPTFPKKGLFSTPKYMSLPATPIGISKRAYYAVAGIAKGFHIDRLEKKLINEDTDDHT